MSQDLIRKIFLCVILIAIPAGLYFGLEWEEETIDMGPGKEATRQPFLALQQFFSLNKVDIDLDGRYSWLDDTSLRFSTRDAVLLVDSYGTLSPERAERLMSWVASGGHLMITASNPRLYSRDVKDYIFEQFEVFRSDQRTSDLDYEVVEKLEPVQRLIFSDSESCDLAKPNTTLTFKGDESPVNAAFINSYYLSTNDENALFADGPIDKSLIIQHGYNQGLVTFVSSLDLWKNRLIGCYDHAYIANNLLGNKNKVWMLFNREASGPLKLIAEFVPATFLALLVTLIFWLFHISGRFGPRRLSPIEKERDWKEHLLAIGQFYLRHHQKTQMIDTMRQRIWQRWNSSYSHLPQHGDEAIHALANHLDRTTENVQHIMTSTAPQGSPAFVHLTRQLQEIRNKI